ncbi:MAG: OsmC family protein [Thermoleophilaceae bacterium]
MRYDARIRWTGSTGLGWDSYDRTHTVAAPPAVAEIGMTTGESKGDPRLNNPEQLLVMAASSCQMLWFLHLAAKARIDVVEYTDEAIGEMPESRFTRIALRPLIKVATADASEDRIRRLAELAHHECNIAKSLSCEVTVEPRIEVQPARAR